MFLHSRWPANAAVCRLTNKAKGQLRHEQLLFEIRPFRLA